MRAALLAKEVLPMDEILAAFAALSDIGSFVRDLLKEHKQKDSAGKKRRQSTNA